jgi:hypothetical protein
MQRLKSLWRHHWLKAIPALMTVLVLAPAPVMAFQWVSGWVEVANTHTIPQTGIPAFTSTDNGTNSGGTLSVNMFSANGVGLHAGSAIELTRQLQITGTSERVETTSQFANIALQNAALKVQVYYTPVIASGGAAQRTAFTIKRNIGNNGGSPATVQGDTDRFTRLRSGGLPNNGQYVVHVKITYTTRGRQGVNNGWTSTGTPHQFTFQGGF